MLCAGYSSSSPAFFRTLALFPLRFLSFPRAPLSWPMDDYYPPGPPGFPVFRLFEPVRDFFSGGAGFSLRSVLL